MIDLHLHSNVTKPDGGDCPPRKIIEEAKRVGLSAVALTDHDSVAGLPEALETAKEHQVKFVPGVEIACNFLHIDIEVIGLGVDFGTMCPYLDRSLDQITEQKQDFINRSIKRCQELGFTVPKIKVPEDKYFDELAAIVHTIAEIPVNKEVYEKIVGQPPISEKDFYIHLFAPGKPCRVIKDIRPFQETLTMIKQAGGKTFLAHPKRADQSLAHLTDDYIDQAVAQGLDGIECIHPKMMPKDSVALMEYCRKKNLLMSGGTDAHNLRMLECWNQRLNVPDEFIGWYFQQ